LPCTPAAAADRTADASVSDSDGEDLGEEEMLARMMAHSLRSMNGGGGGVAPAASKGRGGGAANGSAGDGGGTDSRQVGDRWATRVRYAC
jgi:hypothetical protein